MYSSIDPKTDTFNVVYGTAMGACIGCAAGLLNPLTLPLLAVYFPMRAVKGCIHSLID